MSAETKDKLERVAEVIYAACHDTNVNDLEPHDRETAHELIPLLLPVAGLALEDAAFEAKFAGIPALTIATAPYAKEEAVGVWLINRAHIARLHEWANKLQEDSPTASKARELRECVFCGEKVPMSHATEKWEAAHATLTSSAHVKSMIG